MALITVLKTEGSTYSKAGNQMLVNADGDFHGMLSGGCLEGDLADRAQAAIDDAVAVLHTYDLRGDDDVFGLGVGCEGTIRILIQPLTASRDYEPLSSLVQELQHARSAEFLLSDGVRDFGTVTLMAPLRVLLLGAGQDADPLIQFGVALGWEITVCDHRKAAIDRIGSLSPADAHCVPAAELSNAVKLERYDAAIVMSHNLDADRQYLRILADSKIEFLGLLGPPHRKARLLGDIGTAAERLQGRLRGPVGRQIGGRGAAAIALEIAAELQAYFSLS